MSELKRVPDGIDTSVPSSARVYDYLLGGTDNSALDRMVAEKLLSVAPDARTVARATRAFLARAVRYVASQGIRQYVDLGAGLPTSPSVHEIARESVPDARVVYVDYDPLVKIRNDATFAADEGVITLRRDVRDPEAILGDPDLRAVVDFGEPVAVLLLGVLHFVSDDEGAHDIVAAWRGCMAPGSHVIISNLTADSDPEALARLAAATAGSPAESTIRSHDELARFFDGFTLVVPGLVPVQEWRPSPEESAIGAKVVVEGGVGVLS
ncbi:SAM-dependent methyltransferase [Microtetraspora malaysiensis]|uniref:SAM-dependent methyltransferase n=1 Tax=Microtetraspora malaysiensis TaxID=161358 RepID=A0ABW6T280_9ACTN